jgi:hypothetical protein
MPLPDFNADGDLPPGVYATTWGEMVGRFGAAEGRREECIRRLAHVRTLAARTDCLDRLVIFGSFVTAKPEPNDVDIVLIMNDRFRLEDCPLESRGLFDHAVAQARYGVSAFWIRPELLIGESVEEFIAYWQVKRGGTRRGIVELKS